MQVQLSCYIYICYNGENPLLLFQFLFSEFHTSHSANALLGLRQGYGEVVHLSLGGEA